MKLNKYLSLIIGSLVLGFSLQGYAVQIDECLKNCNRNYRDQLPLANFVFDFAERAPKDQTKEDFCVANENALDQCYGDRTRAQVVAGTCKYMLELAAWYAGKDIDNFKSCKVLCGKFLATYCGRSKT